MRPPNIIFTTLATALATLLAPIASNAQPLTGEDQPLRFAVTEWSFGDVREEGGVVAHTFEFTNRGTTPVAIDRVATSCGCTTPDYPKTPVAPGASARLDVVFDPRGMPGEFSKIVTVISGGGKFREYLTVTGRVIPRPRTVEEDYPNDMGGGLRLSTTLLSFRTVAQGSVVSMVTRWANTSTEPVTLAMQNDEQSGLLEIHAPETLCGGCRGDITFTYDLSRRTAYGPMVDVVRPVVDGTPAKATIYASATGVDNFVGADAAAAPKLFFDAMFHNFGEVRQRTVPYTFRLTASNEGSSELHIRAVTTSAGLQTSLREGMTLAPGASLPFEVMFYSNRHEPGEVQATIGIVVDDPMRPTREIRVAAILRK
ncbi:MAG: DUF1573 domain-containing protein [Alistipes sp.]|jgi:hypothetical protein|nr:DUF1573 domain-containing protein [Alistipes sp.]